MSASIRSLPNHWPRRAGPFAALAALFALLTGCSVFPENEPVQLLDPRPAPAKATSAAPWSLSIARPESDPARNSTRVLFRTTDARLQVHADARWIAPAPELLRMLMIRSLRDAGALARVETTGAESDRLLLSDLRRFEVAESADGILAATLEIEVRLYDAASDDLVARRLLEHRRPVASAEPTDVLSAFDSALAEMLGELSAWLADQPAPAPSD